MPYERKIAVFKFLKKLSISRNAVFLLSEQIMNSQFVKKTSINLVAQSIGLS